MQTDFLPELLADPQMRESERIIHSCVHCGFCTATCPTYLLLGDERDSPRGRIYLMKEMLEKNLPATPEVVTHIDRCLSCLSCMTTCPSGVNYMHLVDHGRAHIEKTFRRPLVDRVLRTVLAKTLPFPGRFRAALMLGSLAAPLRPLFGATAALRPVAAMLGLAPGAPPRAAPPPPVAGAEGEERGRVALLRGCVQSVLAPGINAAAVRLLNRAGVSVFAVPGEGCCGALVHHLGREDEALAFARANVDAWTRAIEAHRLDAILVTASGCGTMLKDYGFMLREDAAYAGKAARVSALAKDISEYLAAIGLPPAAIATGQAVTYHSACSLQHGQQIRDELKALLRAAGFKVKDVPEGHICCGSAGTYNILQPALSAGLRDRKAANIAKTAPAVVAAGNIGCITQLKGAVGAPVVHTVELLDWATGGPVPPGFDPDARPAVGPLAASTPPTPAPAL
ncbi:MAG TPA: glycolate oxidase subunit GlcF [Hyphomicrobiales bacterium]|nr:glycolate oxidase subunit GlcF [Hyphomicrobiales bacterium]